MVVEHVRRISRETPHRPAVSWPLRGGTLGTWTYGELATRIDEASALLRRAALSTKCIALMVRQLPGSVAAVLAAEECGYLCIMIAASLPVEEIHGLLDDHYFVRPLQIVEGTDAFLSSIQTPGTQETVKDEGSIGQLTSGSTGASRVAVRSATAVSVEVDAVSSTIGLHDEDRVICASSISHSYGLMGGVLAPLSCGAHVTLLDNSTQATTVVSESKATIVFGLSRFYSDLLAGEAMASSLDGVRLAFSAGAPLPRGLYKAFLNRTGVSIRQDYGTTETGTICLDTTPFGQPETVGAPLSHVEVRLAHSTFKPVLQAVEGEIQVRSTGVASGYLHREKLIPCTDSEGWYPTRDTGWIREDGMLCVGARLRDAILVNEVPVRPEVVEAALQLVPGVKDVVVVPYTEGATSGLKVVAVASQQSVSLLRYRLEHDLDLQARHVTVELRDALPRSPAGKILHKYLR